jgi:hypothetical protein
MRKLILVTLAFIPALALGACAEDGPHRGSTITGDDLAKLTDDCHAHGGIVAPSGRSTSRVQEDYVCNITDAPGLPNKGG